MCIVRLPENAVQEQVRALTERLCGEESEVCAFFRGSRRLVLLLRGETEEAVRETAYEFCQNLRHELCQVLGWNALCAIGAPVSRVSALPESYRTAKDTLLQASAYAEDGVFGSTDFAGVQHEFDFSAGGSLADKSQNFHEKSSFCAEYAVFRFLRRRDLSAIIIRGVWEMHTSVFFCFYLQLCESSKEESL